MFYCLLLLPFNVSDKCEYIMSDLGKSDLSLPVNHTCNSLCQGFSGLKYRELNKCFYLLWICNAKLNPFSLQSTLDFECYICALSKSESLICNYLDTVLKFVQFLCTLAFLKYIFVLKNKWINNKNELMNTNVIQCICTCISSFTSTICF